MQYSHEKLLNDNANNTDDFKKTLNRLKVLTNEKTRQRKFNNLIALTTITVIAIVMIVLFSLHI